MLILLQVTNEIQENPKENEKENKNFFEIFFLKKIKNFKKQNIHNFSKFINKNKILISIFWILFLYLFTFFYSFYIFNLNNHTDFFRDTWIFFSINSDIVYLFVGLFLYFILNTIIFLFVLFSLFSLSFLRKKIREFNAVKEWKLVKNFFLIFFLLTITLFSVLWSFKFLDDLNLNLGLFSLTILDQLKYFFLSYLILYLSIFSTLMIVNELNYFYKWLKYFVNIFLGIIFLMIIIVFWHSVITFTTIAINNLYQENKFLLDNKNIYYVKYELINFYWIKDYCNNEIKFINKDNIDFRELEAIVHSSNVNSRDDLLDKLNMTKKEFNRKLYLNCNENKPLSN